MSDNVIRFPKPDSGDEVPSPWFRFFPKDWLMATRTLSAAERAVLIDLVVNMHERGKPLAEDHARLARLCNLPTHNFRRCLDALLAGGLVIVTPGGLWSPMVQGEVDFRRDKRAAYQQKRDMTTQNRRVMSGKSSMKSKGEIDRDSESQRDKGINPLSQRSTVDVVGESRLNGASPSTAENRSGFSVGDHVLIDGERFEIEAISATLASVRSVWTGEGRENVPLARMTAALPIDELDDDLP